MSFEGRHRCGWKIIYLVAWVASVGAHTFLFGAIEQWKSLYNQGVRAIESDDPRGAARLLEKAAALQPRNPNVLLGLASAYFKLGKPQQGLKKVQDSLSLPGLDFKTLMAAGHLLVSNGLIEKAIEVFEAAQKKAPPILDGQTSSVYFGKLYADLLAESKRNQEAVSQLQRLVVAEPNDPEIRFKLVLMLARTADFGGSYAAAQQALKRFPENPQILLSYALACYFTERTENAESAYLRLIQMEPDSDQPYFALGNFYADLGRFSDAAKYFRLAVSKNPKNYLNDYMYGVALFRLQMLAEATLALKEALGLNPSHADSFYWLGRIALRKGKTAEALEAFRTTIKLEPKHIGAYYQLGLLYAHAGDREKSEEMFRIQKQLNEDIHKGIIAERMP